MNRGRIRDLYVVIRVSFCWPQLVPARAFMMFSRGDAREIIDETWEEKVKWGSKITPRMRGFLLRGRKELRRDTCGWRWDWCKSEVKSVTDDFAGDTESPLSSAHAETFAA